MKKRTWPGAGGCRIESPTYSGTESAGAAERLARADSALIAGAQKMYGVQGQLTEKQRRALQNFFAARAEDLRKL